MNMWLTDAADDGCGGGLDFASMHAIPFVGQCDVEECFKCTQCVTIYIVHGYNEAWIYCKYNFRNCDFTCYQEQVRGCN